MATEILFLNSLSNIRIVFSITLSIFIPVNELILKIDTFTKIFLINFSILFKVFSLEMSILLAHITIFESV